MRSAVVIIVDRLGASWLGPYGNTWVETPALNRLACESFLVENAVVDSPTLAGFHRSLWSGRHAACADVSLSSPLHEALSTRATKRVLMTDELALEGTFSAEAFDEVIRVPVSTVASPAADIAETQLAQLFAACVETIEAQRDPFLLWMHARGMGGPWDAPLALRDRYTDEDDPSPARGVEPPDRVLAKNFDPDELLGLTHAYAGHVTLVDACMDFLLEALPHSPLADQTLLAFGSPRGFPLGEHRRIGGGDSVLYSELLHTPWLFRFPRQQHATERLQTLAQPADVGVTLAEWFADEAVTTTWGRTLCSVNRSLPLAGESGAAYAFAEQEQTLRAPAWLLRRSEAERPELFVKPDDRWEVNEIADREPAILEAMLQHLTVHAAAAERGDRRGLPRLDEMLIEHVQ